jgi:UDP-glucose 4-epimerase
MNVLITGGAGFIGSHLADALLGLGHTVTCLDDLSLGTRRNLAHLESVDRFRFVLCDILDQPKLHDAFSNGAFDIVFHMAANSDIQAGATDRSVDLDRTFHTTFEVLQAMKDHGVDKLVFASTSAIYGELDELLHEEIGPLFPISFYGAAKLASEGYISAFSANFDLQAWIFRFPNVVGERSTHGAIFDFINKLEKTPDELEILGDGSQEKPYLYVKDLVDGILFGWQNSSQPLNFFNLGVDSRTNVTRMAEMVREEMQLTTAHLRYTGGSRGWVGDVPKFDYDLSKINALGWKARRSSDDAVRLAIQAELALRKTQ